MKTHMAGKDPGKAGAKAQARDKAPAGMASAPESWSPFPAPLFRTASCACGGGCSACQSTSGGPVVSGPGDPEEIEAERMAEAAMRMPDDALADPGIGPSGGLHPMGVPTLLRSIGAHGVPFDGPNAVPAPPAPGRLIPSGGSPLGSDDRAFFERRFGADLGHVRLHTGSEAERAAESVEARAFTYGRDIVVGRGESAGPGWRRLLAHELVHVLQHGQPDGPPTGVSRPHDPGEREADTLSRQAAAEGAARIDAPVKPLRGNTLIHRERIDPPDPRPWRTSQRWILIDLPHHLYFYEGFRRTHTFRVSGGMPAHPTPTGYFRIDHRDAGHRSSTYGHCINRDGDRRRTGDGAGSCREGESYLGADMAFFQRFAPRVGLHRGDPEAASHGCIHVHRDRVREAWDLGRVGMIVVVCSDCSAYLDAIRTAREAADESRGTGRH